MKKTNRSQVRQSGKRVQVFKSEANLGSARLRAIPFALAIAFGSSSSFADPAGAVVAAGQAAISSANGITTIQQMSDRAVVNWQSFNVNASEVVKFVQPSSTAAILNRVTGGSVSSINGLVEGNGRVYLINPNGIVVGANGVVNVNGGFVASTKSLADNAFMSGGTLVFTGESTGSIQILGKVQSAQGDVILIAPKIAIEKTGSLIAGQTIKLVAANEVELSNGKFTVKPKAGDAGQLTVEGALEAAKVQLAANNNNLGALAINTTGTIRATGTQTNPDGSVSIIATGEGGNINISGNIRSEKGDGNGGAVTVLADNTIRVSGTINANSSDMSKVGGDIYIGRDITTNKLARATDVSGATLLSNKGFVETSAHFLAVDGARVEAANWLLDPDNIDITGDATAATGGYSKIKASDIVANLNIGTSVTISTSATAGASSNQPAYVGATATGDGNILVNATISKTSGGDASLTLLADNGITVNQAITSTSNKLNVTMTAKGLGASSQGLVINKSIDANGGAIDLTGNTSNGVAAVTIASSALIQGASVTMVGNSATGAAFNGTGKVNATAGNVSITGTGNNGGGYAITTNNTIDATGNIEINTTSAAKHGIALGGNVTSSGGGVTIYSDVLTAGSGSAINGSFAIKAKNDISITGKTKGYYSINGLGAIESTDKNVTVDGSSTGSMGVNLTNNISAANGHVALTGTGGNAEGVVFNNGSGINAKSYDVQGTSATNIGVKFNGTTTFTSIADSKIEGKNSSGGTGVYAGGSTININSGAGKVIVQNQTEAPGSVSGGMELRSGTTLNTTGDVTFGRKDQANNTLFLQGLKATATGGKLTFLGSSSSKDGIAFQDFGGGAVNINGINGAQILIDGKSTANGSSGVNMRLVAAVTHNVTSSGAGGSISITGNSTSGTGVSVDIAKITANDGNAINITGSGVNASGVYIANAITANGGGNINITGTSAGTITGNAIQFLTNGGAGKIIADTGKVTVKGEVNASAGAGNGIYTTGTISGGSVELEGTSNRNYGIYSTNAITSTVGNVNITGTSTATNGAYGVSSLGAIVSKANLNIKGSATTGHGAWIQNTVGTGAAIKIEGTTQAAAKYGVVNYGTLTANGIDSNGTAIDIKGDSGDGTVASTGFISYGAINNNSTGGLTSIKATKGDISLSPTSSITNASTAGVVKLEAGDGTATSLSKISAGVGPSGRATITQNSNAGITMTTDGVGDLTVAKIINNGSGDVILAAGKQLAAGNGAGGQIKTVTGNNVGGNGAGKLYVYTGSAAGTGLLETLTGGSNTGFSTLSLSDYTDGSSTIKQNAAANVAYTTGSSRSVISPNTTSAQVMFREKVAIDSSSLNGASLGLTYGDADTNVSQTAALFSKMQAALRQNNLGTTVATTTLTNPSTSGINTFRISKAAVINDMTGSLTSPSYSTSQHLTATTHNYGVLNGTNYTTSLAANKAQVVVRKLPIQVFAQYTSLNYTGALLTQNQPSYPFISSDRVNVSGLATGTAVGSYLSALRANGDDVGNYDIQFVNDNLVIAYSGANKAPTPPETYTRIAGDVVNLVPLGFAVGVAAATAAGDEADPNICYAWGQRNGGSVTVHTVLKPAYLGLRHAKTDTQEAMSNSGGSSSHGASPCGHEVATNVAVAESI